MIDSHCHLLDEKLVNDLNNVILSYENAGVDAVMNMSINIRDAKQIIEISKRYYSVYYTLGVHPEDLEDYDEESLEYLIRQCLGLNLNTQKTLDNSNNIKYNKIFDKYNDITPLYDINGNNKFLAIGEIGLDYFWRKDNKEEQIKVFESQIKLAKKYDLPIIIHNREASGDILEILKQNAPYASGGIIHCFSASLEWAKEVMKLGFYISFSGTLTYKNAKNIQAVAKEIPLDRLLVETDSPYLTPEPFRGQTNEPKFVIETAKFLANLRDLSLNEIEDIATSNFKRLFKLK